MGLGGLAELKLGSRDRNRVMADYGRRCSPFVEALVSPSRCVLAVVLALLAAIVPLSGREKEKLAYGEGLIVNLPVPEGEAAQVVEDVAENGMIRGTKEYNKDEFVSGAKAATTSPVFPPWNEGGKVFYKIREHAIDPRNFKDGGDVGTLAVRYVVQAQGEKNTVLRIDALFQEDFRRTIHQSNGSVESSEYKDIQEHLETIRVMKEQTAEAERERQERRAKQQSIAARYDTATATAQKSTGGAASQSPGPQEAETENSTSSDSRMQSSDQTQPVATSPAQTSSAQTPEQRIKDLRAQVERIVKAPGAPLKSAPFHTAGTLQLLGTGTEVLILISTPYWYGVETHEGQHGWIMRDQLEQP